MTDIEIIVVEIRRVFPNLPQSHAKRLAKLVLSVSDDFAEALWIIRSIPRRNYGSFRLNCETKEWEITDDRPDLTKQKRNTNYY